MSDWELPSSVESTSIERVGGGFIWESGVYDVSVKLAYLDQAKSEAISFNVVLENSEGKELKETFWIKSGKAKGNKTFYTKDGKDFPLPGYAVANSLCVAFTGNSLAKCMESAEKKTINIYNFDQKKEVPTERPVVMGILNTKGKVAVHQVVEDKNVKNEAGEYIPSGDTRNVNECKFFGNEAGKTTEEILAGDEATKFDAWAAKNTGNVIDKSGKSKKESSAAAIMGNGAKAEDKSGASSLFS